MPMALRTTQALPVLLTTIFLAAPLRAQPDSPRAAPEPQGAQAPLAIDAAAASRFVRLALTCVRKEYPNKLDHVMNGAPEVRSPRDLHPAFYGCFDWHSSVHGHWMMVRLLRRFPALPESAEIRAALDESLAPGNVAAEVAYWRPPARRTSDRTSAWPWPLARPP